MVSIIIGFALILVGIAFGMALTYILIEHTRKDIISLSFRKAELLLDKIELQNEIEALKTLRKQTISELETQYHLKEIQCEISQDSEGTCTTK